ncbi:PAS domain-containing protein, partial [Patescibacteria group bacterium]|nr:PAS domain-containing protein [Patescibacteria group bacterium]
MIEFGIKNYKEILNNTTIGIIVASGVSMKINFVNRRMAQILGLSMTEMKDMKVIDISKFIHPEDRKAFFQCYKDISSGKKMPPEKEFRVLHKKGKEKFLLYHFDLIKLSGEPVLQGSFVDITKQKKLQKDLMQAKLRYDLASSVASQMFYNFDVETGQIDLFGAIKDVLGYSPEEFRKVNIKKWESMIHPKDRTQAMKTLFSAKKRLGTYDIKYRFKHKEGHYLIVHDVGRCTKGELSQNLSLLGSMCDITFLEQSLKVIEHNEEKLRGLLGAMDELVFELNEGGEFTFFHAPEEKMLYMKPVDFMNKHYSKVMPPNISKLINEAVEINKQGKQTNFEYSLDLKNEKLWFGASMTPLYNSDKKYNGSVAVIRDISIEKRVDIMKTEFVSLASHQLRTPITSIGWNCEILLKDAHLEPENKNLVKEMLDSNGRMNDLIDALLNVSRLEMGRIDFTPVKIKPLDVCKSVVKEMDLIIKEKNITIEYRNDSEIDFIKVDKGMLEVVFQNLISN